MDKEKCISKILNYDEFKCIADRCRFTCCEGWDVSIDEDTYNKWKKDKDKQIFKNVKIKKGGGKTGYFINKENHEACPLLDKQGLCEIVKSRGEDYLSLTCHKFPRIENIFEEKKELSLSCACPEVVEVISSITGKINLISENGTDSEFQLLELEIREALINIVQQEGFSLEDKLIVSFQMLLTILDDDENFNEDSVLEELENYKNKDHIQKLINTYKKIESNINDSVEEMNFLFLDIIKNYKEVSSFEIFLKDIADFAENARIENLSAKWHSYKGLFEKYSMLNENCISSDILSSCISNDIYDMTISFEMIIVEYLLVRYAVFLKCCINEKQEINDEDIKDYIVVFARIIGNNTEAVIEFFKDGFGEAVLEMGYLHFITLF